MRGHLVNDMFCGIFRHVSHCSLLTTNAPRVVTLLITCSAAYSVMCHTAASTDTLMFMYFNELNFCILTEYDIYVVLLLKPL